MPRSSPFHCHLQIPVVPANFLPGPGGAFGELADPLDIGNRTISKPRKAFVDQSDGFIGQVKEMAAGLEMVFHEAPLIPGGDKLHGQSVRNARSVR